MFCSNPCQLKLVQLTMFMSLVPAQTLDFRHISWNKRANKSAGTTTWTGILQLQKHFAYTADEGLLTKMPPFSGTLYTRVMYTKSIIMAWNHSHTWQTFFFCLHPNSVFLMFFHPATLPSHISASSLLCFHIKRAGPLLTIMHLS